MPVISKTSLAFVFCVAAAAGCSHPAQTISSTAIQKENAAQQQFHGMSAAQLTDQMRADPRRVRQMLMPPGMGDPHLRLGTNSPVTSGPTADGTGVNRPIQGSNP